jgi:hypothetical protein
LPPRARLLRSKGGSCSPASRVPCRGGPGLRRPRGRLAGRASLMAATGGPSCAAGSRSPARPARKPSRGTAPPPDRSEREEARPCPTSALPNLDGPFRASCAPSSATWSADRSLARHSWPWPPRSSRAGLPRACCRCLRSSRGRWCWAVSFPSRWVSPRPGFSAGRPTAPDRAAPQGRASRASREGSGWPIRPDRGASAGPRARGGRSLRCKPTARCAWASRSA